MMYDQSCMYLINKFENKVDDKKKKKSHNTDHKIIITK